MLTKFHWCCSLSVVLVFVLRYTEDRNNLQNENHSQQGALKMQPLLDEEILLLDWWKPFVDQVAKPFPILYNQSWCVPQKIRERESINDNSTDKSGLYLVKIPKTASSTAAGVSIQIARNVMNRELSRNNKIGNQSTFLSSPMECIYHVSHGPAHVQRIDPYLLWTVVREPTKRAISHYFFELVSRQGTWVTSEGMINELKRHKNLQFKRLAMVYINSADGPATAGTGSTRYIVESQKTTRMNIIEMLQKDIFGNFHFVGVSERMEESLVALKMILQLETQDVIVLSSKVNGGLDDGNFDGTCVKIQPSFTTPEVDTYLEKEFYKLNHDFFLHAVANRSLDLTIDSLGREKFDRELVTYRRMKQYAEYHCLNTTIFPCVVAGEPPLPESKNSCFDGDIGCGHECVQKVLAKLGRGKFD